MKCQTFPPILASEERATNTILTWFYFLPCVQSEVFLSRHVLVSYLVYRIRLSCPDMFLLLVYIRKLFYPNIWLFYSYIFLFLAVCMELGFLQFFSWHAFVSYLVYRVKFVLSWHVLLSYHMYRVRFSCPYMFLFLTLKGGLGCLMCFLPVSPPHPHPHPKSGISGLSFDSTLILVLLPAWYCSFCLVFFLPSGPFSWLFSHKILQYFSFKR